MTGFKAPVFEELDKIIAEIGKKIDAIVTPKYIDPMTEVKMLCNEHREELKCDISV